MANHIENTYFRITLDIGNYREKRKDTLEVLGKKIANKAVKSGRNCSLEPMNPYERRIIHTAVQTVEGAKSWSEGEDLNRHVVIGPVDGERPQPRKPYHSRGPRKPYGDKSRGDYHKNNYGGRGPRPQGQRPAGQTQQRSQPRKETSGPLYGRIDINRNKDGE